MRKNGNSIIWTDKIRTVRDKLKPITHQKIEVFDGRVHILTFREISNPILYDHWGNSLAQINKEYLTVNIDNMRNISEKNGETIFVFDIENYV